METIHSIPQCISALTNPNITVKDKYDTLFHLKAHDTYEAVQALISNYNALMGSELLQHEMMYILGQIDKPFVIDFLISVLNSENEAPVVRHEAGEALANYHGDKERILIELEKFVNSEVSVIRSTARIAIRKMLAYGPNHNYKKYVEGNIEPADPFTESELKSYIKRTKVYHEDLLPVLLNEQVDEFTKYKIMYYLRNHGDEQALLTLMRLLEPINRALTSPLLRHEVCFIIGQLQGKADYPFVRKGLFRAIKDIDEESIVRHEAVLSYNDIWGNEDLSEILENEKDRLVAESILIVLD